MGEVMKQLRRYLRIAAGLVCIVVGIPLYVLPVPLGIVFVGGGLALLTCRTAVYGRLVDRLEKRFPGPLRRLRPLLNTCRPRAGAFCPDMAAPCTHRDAQLSPSSETAHRSTPAGTDSS